MPNSDDSTETTAAPKENTDALSVIAAEHRSRLDSVERHLWIVETGVCIGSLAFSFFLGTSWFSFKAAIDRAAEQIVAERLPAAVNRALTERLPQAAGDAVAKALPEAAEQIVAERLPAAVDRSLTEKLPKAVGDQVTKALPEAIAALRASPDESVLAAGGKVIRTGDLVTAISLCNTDVSDGFLARLGQGGKWANVSAFDLSKTRVTDSGMKTLAQYPSLEKLDLYATATTDAGLAQLTHLRKLKSINLQDTQLTDQGARTLAGFPELRELNLRNTRITDDGLVALRTLQHLESLDVRGTRVTRSGVAALKAALPKLAIHADF